MDPLNPNLARQQRVECATQLARISGPALGAQKTDSLPERVDARIGASCSCRRRPTPHQPLEHRLEFSLDRAIDGLPLPPCETAPVVLNHREVGAARHAGKDATRCHYLTRVIALILHGLPAAPRADRARQPPNAFRGSA